MPTPYVGDGGVWEALTPSVGDGGAHVPVREAWVGDGGAWVKIYDTVVAQVTGLSVAVLSSSSLRLTWDAITGVDGYKVERSPDGSTGWAEVQDVTSGETWDDTSRNDGTRYYYRVRAYVAAYYGLYSSTANNVTTLKAPVLTSASAGAGDPTSEADLVLTDGGSVAETEIRVYVSTVGPSSGFGRVSSAGYTGDPIAANATAATIGAMADDTTFWFKLANYNADAGESAFSSVQSMTTDAAVPSGPPAWASTYPKDNPSDDDGILLRLIAAPDATTYDVYYKIGSNMAGDPVTNGTYLGNFTGAQIVSATYTHATGQSHGTVIYYNARGRNAAGPGAFMASDASATVTMRVPGTPTIGTATNVGADATIPWSAGSPDNASLYRIQEEYRTTPGGVFGSTATFTDSASPAARAMADGREYRWRVRAENDAGNSSYSAWSNGVIYTITPGIPTGVSLDYDGTNPASELVASWSLPGSGTIDGYELEVVAYSSSFTGTPTHTASGGATTSKRITGLSDDTRYKVQVRAVNDWGDEGTWSSSADEWTAPSTPGTPSWSSGWPKATAKDTLQLKVGPAADADTYRFYGGGGLLTEQAGTSYDWTGRSPNTQYTGLYVTAVNKATVGSPHADVEGSATSSQSRYTLREAPDITAVVDNSSMCPTQMQKDVTVSHLNGDGVGRSETFKVDIYDGSWTNDSTQSADVTGFTIPVGAGDSQVRAYYSSESSATADTNGLGIVVCPE